MKVKNYIDTSLVDTIVSDSVCHSDSVADYGLYTDFKFITETLSNPYEGPIEREVTFVGAGWNFVILLIAIVLMVANKFFAPQRFSVMMTLPFQSGGGEKVIRETNLFFNIVSLSILVSFILLFSIFIQKFYLIYGGNHILHENIGFFWDVVLAVATMIIFNYLLTLLYSWLFNSEEILMLHVSLLVSTMASAILVLIPSVLMLLYYPYKHVFIIVLLMLTVIFAIRFIKLLTEVLMLSRLNFVNIFLYLCTIEILPILVMSKMVLMIV